MTKGVYKRQTKEETKRKLEKLKELKSLPLVKKIEISNNVIKESIKIDGNACLLFSGGKDSTVLFDLLKKNGVEFFAMYNNTSLGDKKTDEFTRRIAKIMDVEYVETIAENPVDMWKNKGYFPILPKRTFNKYKKLNPDLNISPVQCCYQLKEKYANKEMLKRNVKVVYWGNRAGESNRRKFSFVDNGFLFKPKKYKWFQCYPLQHWTKEDIKDYICKNIPNYPINSRLESGCLCCATDIQFKFNTLKKLHDSDYEKWLFYIRCGFGAEILKIKGIDPSNLEKIIETKKEILFRI